MPTRVQVQTSNGRNYELSKTHLAAVETAKSAKARDNLIQFLSSIETPYKKRDEVSYHPRIEGVTK